MSGSPGDTRRRLDDVSPDGNTGWNSSALGYLRLDPEMVESENSGSGIHSSRFAISRTDDFEMARVFARTIGTDVHAERWRDDPPDSNS
jgi:hypothetical protein